MNAQDERTHQFPVPKQPLPELTRGERRMLLRLGRMVKSGQLWGFRSRLHEEKGNLTMEWSDDGGACMAP